MGVLVYPWGMSLEEYTKWLAEWGEKIPFYPRYNEHERLDNHERGMYSSK